MSNSSLRLQRAMVMAAGLGLRLRPLTEQLPKPLVQVAGRSLVDRVLDRLAAVGVETAVVNLHYKPEMLRAHLEKRAQETGPALAFSDEADSLLETGGGIAKALPLLGEAPFLVANSDVIWRDAVEDSLALLAQRWDGAQMDALLLLQPTVWAHGYDGPGDFNMAPDGQLCWRPERDIAPFVFAGVQILHPKLFVDCPAGPFAVTELLRQAEEAGRLFGIRHEGEWVHVGDPAGLAVAQRMLSET